MITFALASALIALVFIATATATATAIARVLVITSVIGTAFIALAIVIGLASVNGTAFIALASVFGLALVFVKAIDLIKTIDFVITRAIAIVLAIVPAITKNFITHRQNDPDNNRRTRVSCLYFVMDEEKRRHLKDLRQQWWSETRHLSKFQQRWVVWRKTRAYETQMLWAMGVMKLEEVLGLYRSP